MPELPSLLIVDDEPDLVWALALCLRQEGYRVYTAPDGAAGLAQARRHRPALILLDIMMPTLDGLAVCRQLRADPLLAATPILFLSSRATVQARIEGLQSGADDYLGKPCDLGELKARVAALLRRAQAAWRPVFQLDETTCEVRVGERRCLLSPTEFRLLHYLLAHSGQSFTAAHLLRAVWGYQPGIGNAGLVRWHISRLRQKLEADPRNPAYLRTRGRYGYCLALEPAPAGGSPPEPLREC